MRVQLLDGFALDPGPRVHDGEKEMVAGVRVARRLQIANGLDRKSVV